MTRVEMAQRLIIDIDTDFELLELVKTNPEWELIGVRRWNSKDNKFHELTFENVVTITDTSLVKLQLLLADKEIKY